MNDLESRIRDAFRDHEGDAPAFDLSDARHVAGRTRRRQILNAAVAGIAALAVVVALTAGLGGLVRAERIPADQPPPAPAVASGALVYASEGDIYIAEPDGSNAVRITDIDAVDDECPGELGYGLPSWSPDGRYLAFRGPHDAGCSSPAGVVITDPQGNVVAKFPGQEEQVNLMAPDWSADSTRVAVWDDYARTIGVYRIDGTRETQIGMPPGWRQGDLGDLAWMPDGHSLLVDQYEVSLDGTARELPFPFKEFNSQPQSYSPDASQVAYATRDALKVAQPDGSEPRAVFAPAPYTWAWSLTGDLIALTAGAPGDPYPWPPNELHVVDVATRSVTKVFEGDRRAILRVVGFSPDGERVLFTNSGAGAHDPDALWGVGVDGSDARQVVEDTTDGAWRSI